MVITMDFRHTFKTLGLSIKFPFQPYGIQRAMMNKITSILINKEHTLIESPTGTGKTLVLLCSSLAWLEKSKSIEQPFISTKLREKIAEERRQKLKQRPCSCGRRENTSEEIIKSKDDLKKPKDDIDKAKDEIKSEKRLKLDIESSPYFEQNSALEKIKPDIVNIDDDDDDCKIVIIDDDSNQKPETKVTEDKPMCTSCLALEAENAYRDVMNEDSMDGDIVSKVRTKIPKIYYGTRTHKQITQVVRELNKTPYKKNLKMCILSSRERTCINQDVRDRSDRNDRCRELVNNKRSNSNSKKQAVEHDICQFYTENKLIAQTYETINYEFEDKAWDIEDACEFGLKHTTCPYYGVRSLQEQADITLCPYNYLLDPTIRSNLNINLTNAIVIIDEAHNLEDICRDSASFIIDTNQIQSIIDTINVASSHYVQGSTVSDSYNFFRSTLTTLKSFLVTYKFQPSDRDNWDNSEKTVLSQEETLRQLTSICLGPDNLSKIKDSLKALTGDDEDSEEKTSRPEENQDSALNSNQLQYIKQLVITLTFMYSNDKKCLNDFRAVINKNLDRDQNRFRPNHRNHHDTSNGVTPNDKYVWQFSLLCMNPAVAFEKVHRNAWSVVVASGTLSPIESLKSELGCMFSQPFEGGHVIDCERIFASIVSYGPNKVELNCAYNNSLKLNFQDEVGFVVRDVCKTVPKGVLCFFPSYDRMDNFCQRWLAKGILKDIENIKGRVFKEQKKLTANEFEKVLARYNIRAKGKGALLLAVFRGKVSEGIDFADDAARAVITIGIPYPNVREVTVDLKRQYNDLTRSSRPQIMTGSDWYACQAFRALNQALGRCIRHKEDWGAVIMIDSRLAAVHSKKNLSKWLQNNISASREYSTMANDLSKFVEKRNPQEKEMNNQSDEEFVDLE